jgi:hypothetical protein
LLRLLHIFDARRANVTGVGAWEPSSREFGIAKGTLLHPRPRWLSERRRVFMGTEIVHQHDFAGRHGRYEHLINIRKEPRAIDGTVEDIRSGDAVIAPRGQKSRRLPVTERRMDDQLRFVPVAPVS